MGTPLKFGQSKLAPEMDEPTGAVYAAVRSKLLSLLSAQNRATGSILEYYKHQIHELKQSQRTISFDDVAVRLANHISNLDHDAFARRMDGAIDHLLLDEFQDTSVTQWQVLRPFAVRSAQSDDAADDLDSPITRSFFCVGDTKQAIYGWRGGVAEIFDAVDTEIPEVTAAEQNKSFRSSPVIIETVNEVFEKLGKVDLVDIKANTPPYDRSIIEDNALRAFSARFPRTHRRANRATWLRASGDQSKNRRQRKRPRKELGVFPHRRRTHRGTLAKGCHEVDWCFDTNEQGRRTIDLPVGRAWRGCESGGRQPVDRFGTGGTGSFRISCGRSTPATDVGSFICRIHRSAKPQS